MDIKIFVPDIGTNNVEVTDILVKIGDYVKKEQGLIVVEGDKTSMEIPSSHDGIVKSIMLKIGDFVKTNSEILILNMKDKPLKITTNFSDEKKTKDNFLFHASPLIRRLARKNNIDLKIIKGSGRKNRILKEDIIAYQDSIKNSYYNHKNKLENYSSTINSNDLYLSDKNKILHLKKIKISAGINLFNSWNSIPHVTQFHEIDITKIERIRKKFNSNNFLNDSKITLLPFLIKALVLSIKKFPLFNSSLSLDKKSIILKKNINIGIVVNTDDGLLIPVIKQNNIKSIIDLALRIKKLANKARSNNLSVNDLNEGTFTVSNLGSISSNYFTPIINLPQVAILGISKSFIKPVWKKRNFVPKLVLPVSLSYDHRVIDGVYASNFLSFISGIISDVSFLIF
ncbi:2-oxo acid dehydrogenase subunit E2 [Buchnera aphidicola (Neophyllaphis varicolor)]|uniref:2-oxo acid dehydrogenase subunit E2 n=1 Tax=Buchnera aphidicola TaxID=9 RepID=UPI0031B824DE